MPDGGQLTMGWHVLSCLAQVADFDVAPGCYVALSVSDTGTGTRLTTCWHEHKPRSPAGGAALYYVTANSCVATAIFQPSTGVWMSAFPGCGASLNQTPSTPLPSARFMAPDICLQPRSAGCRGSDRCAGSRLGRRRRCSYQVIKAAKRHFLAGRPTRATRKVCGQYTSRSGLISCRMVVEISSIDLVVVDSQRISSRLIMASASWTSLRQLTRLA